MTLFNKTKLIIYIISYLVVQNCAEIEPVMLGDTTPIAYSHPVESISIDGMLDDWPNNLVRYPIDKALWNGKNDGKDDFSAYFMSGYDEYDNALYLAIVAQDNELVLGAEDDDINYLDTYILYLNEQYKKTGSGIARYIIAENQNKNSNSETSWDPKLKSLASWNNITYETNSQSNQRVYEIKIILDAPIYSGRVIGIGHLLDDKDVDKQTSYAWINQSGKSNSSRPGTIGMLVFNKANTQFGHLSGRVFWKDTTISGQQPEGVYVHSKQDERKWFYLPTERKSGNFMATLPIGDYKLKAGKSAFFNGDAFFKADTSKTLSFSIKANDTTKAINFELHEIPKPNLNQQANLLYDLNDDAKKSIDKRIISYMDYYQIEGVSFAAFKGDSITYAKAYGVKNNYTKDKLDIHTLFEVASITKTVFTYAVLRLYEKGVINLDEPLYNYLPFEKSSNVDYNKLLTARMILSHKSGLPNWGYSSNIDYKFRPGTDYSYSGEGFEYLKRVVEKITNEDINVILNAEVVKPLGLEHMYFKKNDIAMKSKSHGHSNTFPILKRMPSEVYTAYSLTTNPISLAKFLIALQNRKGLTTETYDLMFAQHTSLPEESKSNIWGYKEYLGLGFFVEEAPYGKVIRHSGSNGDFRAIFRLYDELDMGYVITTNGNTGGFILNNIEKNLINPNELPINR